MTSSSNGTSAAVADLGEAAVLPYFGGLEGEACRLAVIDAWKAQNGTNQPIGGHDLSVSSSSGMTLVEELDAVMMTEPLFQIAKSYCQSQIDAYNVAAGVVCLLEANSAGKYNMTYNEFWNQGAAFYDGDYDLALLFSPWYSPTANFTEVGTLSTCVVGCYTGEGSGCDEWKSWLTNYGKITREQVCSLEYSRLDGEFNNVELCVAMAVANPTNMSKLEYVNSLRYESAVEKECVYKACFPVLGDAVLATFCPTTTITTGVTSSGGFSYGVVSDLKMRAAVLLFSLLVAWLA